MRVRQTSKLIVKQAFILMCMLFLVGCGDPPPMSDQEKEAEEKAMLAYLEKKYNRPFTIESIEEYRNVGFGISDKIEAEWRDASDNLFTVSRSDPGDDYEDTYLSIAAKQVMKERYATDIEKISDEVIFTIEASTRGSESINPASFASLTNSDFEVGVHIVALVDSSYQRENHYVAIQKLLKRLRDEGFFSLRLGIDFILAEHKSKMQVVMADRIGSDTPEEVAKLWEKKEELEAEVRGLYLDTLTYSEYSTYDGVDFNPYEDSIRFVETLYQ